MFSIAFILDALRRINKSVKQGETISKLAILIILSTYFAFLVQSIAFIVILADPPKLPYTDSHPFTVPIFFIVFDAVYVAAIASLATILYRLNA